MPPLFTDSLAARLDRQCLPRVQIASHGAALEAGTVYLAPGGNAHLTVVVVRRLFANSRMVSALLDTVRQSMCCFNHLPGSRARTVGVLLTGMGNDGAAGLKELRSLGARTIVQDEQTSIVFGMPKAAIALGAAEVVAPLERIASEILSLKTKTAA